MSFLRRRVFLYLTRGNAVLLLRHVDFPELLPQVPGGTVEPGEQPAEAALREAREETGLDALGPPELIGRRHAVAGRGAAARSLDAWYYRIAVGDGAPEIWRHVERHAHGGAEDVLFELSWARLDALPRLSDADQMLVERLGGKVGDAGEPLVTRHERTGDEHAIDELILRAFESAPHADGTEHLVVAALRAAGALDVSLIVAADERILGHVALSPVTLSDGHGDWYGLGPISVEPARQRLGIGTWLMQAALDELRARDASGCVLLGDPRFYASVVFHPAFGEVPCASST